MVEFIQGEKFVREEGVKSFVGLSLKVGFSGTGEEQREVGILYFDFCRPHRFAEEELALIRVFGQQVAGTIQSAHLLQRRIEDLSIINEVGQIINTKLNTQELFYSIVSQVAEKLHCSHCTLFLASRGRQDSVSASDNTRSVLRADHASGALHRVKGWAGWVFQKGESLVLADAMEDPRFSPPAGVKIRDRAPCWSCPSRWGIRRSGSSVRIRTSLTGSAKVTVVYWMP